LEVSLNLTPQQIDEIEQQGVEAYPNECCGAMLGRDVSESGATRRVVEKLEPLKNSFSADEQYHRFSLDPRELMQLEKTSSELGLAVLGFYHSHPDHPARPSEYDRTHAWPFYSYLIVAIAKRQPVDMTSWLLDEATEQFAAEEIVKSVKGTP
jgi:proteasome lid subunit RPN8/RPN11